MKTPYLLLALFCLMSSFVFSQDKNRLEFELKDGYENENVQVMGDKGFLMLSSAQESKAGEREIKIDFYNTDLELVKTKKIEIDKSLDPFSSKISGDNLVAFYKNKKGEYAIIKISTGKQEVSKVVGKLPKKARCEYYTVLQDHVYLSMRLKKKPFIYSIHIETGVSNIQPIIINRHRGSKTYVQNLQIDVQAQEMVAFVKVYTGRKTSLVYGMYFNKDGEKLYTYALSEKFNKNILSITSQKIGDEAYVFTGTYGNAISDKSEGLFFFKTDEGKKEDLQLYKYVNLKEFNQFLTRKTEKKIEKKQKKGKEVNVYYRLALHVMKVVDDGYIFLGEAYYPTYRTETYYTTQVVNGVSRSVRQTREVFDGYQYTHALLCKFDKNGKMLWDKTFEMWPGYKPFGVRLFISFKISKEKEITMAFSSYNAITHKAFTLDGEVVKERKKDFITGSLEGDKTRSAFSEIRYWYDDYFIAFGRHRLKNTEDKSVKKRREVFFVNKIEM